GLWGRRARRGGGGGGRRGGGAAGWGRGGGRGGRPGGGPSSFLKGPPGRGEPPPPPYSAGQWMPTQRPAASFACHALPHPTSSSTDENGEGCSTLAASHARTSAAKACSLSVKLRSTTGPRTARAGSARRIAGVHARHLR